MAQYMENLTQIDPEGRFLLPKHGEGDDVDKVTLLRIWIDDAIIQHTPPQSIDNETINFFIDRVIEFNIGLYSGDGVEEIEKNYYIVRRNYYFFYIKVTEIGNFLSNIQKGSIKLI